MINGDSIGRAVLPPGCTASPSFPSRGTSTRWPASWPRVAWALEDAHAARVVHCDVKPANILLDRSHEQRAYLIDFGMGRDLDGMAEFPSQVAGGTVAVYGTGEAFGSPAG